MTTTNSGGTLQNAGRRDFLKDTALCAAAALTGYALSSTGEEAQAAEPVTTQGYVVDQSSTQIRYLNPKIVEVNLTDSLQNPGDMVLGNALSWPTDLVNSNTGTPFVTILVPGNRFLVGGTTFVRLPWGSETTRFAFIAEPKRNGNAKILSFGADLQSGSIMGPANYLSNCLIHRPQTSQIKFIKTEWDEGKPSQDISVMKTPFYDNGIFTDLPDGANIWPTGLNGQNVMCFNLLYQSQNMMLIAQADGLPDANNGERIIVVGALPNAESAQIDGISDIFNDNRVVYVGDMKLDTSWVSFSQTVQLDQENGMPSVISVFSPQSWDFSLPRACDTKGRLVVGYHTYDSGTGDHVVEQYLYDRKSNTIYPFLGTTELNTHDAYDVRLVKKDGHDVARILISQGVRPVYYAALRLT